MSKVSGSARATGRPSRLKPDQVEAIRLMYTAGAQSCGFTNDRWTTGKLAQAIERQFGIRYDQDHVGRLMHKFGLRERRFVYQAACENAVYAAAPQYHPCVAMAAASPA